MVDETEEEWLKRLRAEDKITLKRDLDRKWVLNNREKHRTLSA